MSVSFSAARFVRLLRQRTASSLDALAKGARSAARLGAAPWVFASASGSASNTAATATGQDTRGLDGVFDKDKLNAQMPLKPVYIAPRHPVVLCHGLYGFDVRGPEKLPILQVHYWRGIREALENIGARVHIAKVPGTGGVRERACQLDAMLRSRLESEQVNILGHSMGGLDARYLITHINPKSYSVASLTTVCTPHRGSPFMDWCRDYLSLGYRVDPDQLIRDFATVWKPRCSTSVAATAGSGGSGGMIDDSAGMTDAVLLDRITSIIGHVVKSDASDARQTTQAIDPMDARLREFAHFLTNLLAENASVRETSQLATLAQASDVENNYLARSMSLLRMVYRRVMATLDTPAYACLTTDYCNRFFNPATPNVPGVEYLSIGAFIDSNAVSDKVNPLIIPHDIINRAEGPNDGFVSLKSAEWGHYLGSVCADHFDFTNRWRVTSLGRDFIGTMVYWSDKWSSWLSRNDRPKTTLPDTHANASISAISDNTLAEPGGSNDVVFDGETGRRFDPIDFYLRMGTILYQRGF
ncbi:hypothetical protein FB645_004800 [Coemansia sp. IMI 203386]|nr:hypothetical protein FB645_004800 [Coemansia sp. IMI 203386]